MWDMDDTQRTKKATQKTVIPPALSKGEETMALHLREAGIDYEREFKFCLGRRWRADFALGVCTQHNILIECEGGTYGTSRHTSGKGFEADCEKYNEAAIMGFRVLRFTTRQITSGEAIATIKRAIK